MESVSTDGTVYRLAICDLDGTFVDTSHDLAHAVNQTRKELGLCPLETAEVVSCVGNGMRRLVERSFSGYPELIPVALEALEQHYRACQTSAVSLYPGVRETVETLFERGVLLAVLTNKPQVSAESVLSHVGLRRFFGGVYGDDGQRPLKPDPSTVGQILCETGVARQDCLLVGDSGVDIECAHAAGVFSVFVEGGMGRPHEVLKPGYSVSCIRDILTLWG